MKERDNILFYDTDSLSSTPDIQSRTNTGWLQQALHKRFPGEELNVQSVHCNDTGIYRCGLRKITDLPAFIDIRLAHKTGRHTEHIIVWVPVFWNDRFIGTGGGGTATGGEQYITRPDNTSRGMTLPFAVVNGFAAKELYSYGGEYFRYASPSFRTQRPDHKRVQEYPCRFQGTRYCRFEWDHTVFTCQTGVGVHSKCSRKKYAGQQQGCCQN